MRAVFVSCSLLWTIAILLPDGSSSNDTANYARGSSAAPPKFSLAINGERYVFDTDIRDRADAGDVRATYSAAPGGMRRKLKASSSRTRNAQRRTRQFPISSRTASKTKIASDGSASQPGAPLFSRWAWYGAACALYLAQRARRKRRETYDEGWFARAGLDDRLMYGADPEYEDDFLSVDGSFYGSVSRWSGRELDKFDMDMDI